MRSIFRPLTPARIVTFGIAFMLYACSTVPVHFYTLSSGAQARSSSAISSYAIDVLPISIPVRASVPQLVVRDSAQSVAILEHERWSAPLQDEIRNALAEHLSGALGVIDASSISAASLPTYQVRVDIRSFDAWLDQSTSINAVWSLTAPATSQVALLCPVQLTQAASPGYAGLVQAYQQSLNALGDQLATAIRASESRQNLQCPGTAIAR